MTRWSCRRLRPALVDAAGVRAGAESPALAAHLARCERCRDALATLRAFTADLDETEALLPNEDFWRRQRQAIMRRVRTAAPEPAVGWLGGRSWRVAGALASALLALLVARTPWNPRPSVVTHSIDHLDDDALFHLHDLMPMLAPASSIEDADSDLLTPDLGDDELDNLADILGDAT
jgi:hypothetical protein